LITLIYLDTYTKETIFLFYIFYTCVEKLFMHTQYFVNIDT